MSRETLCYACAVRMTTLWRMPAPPPPPADSTSCHVDCGVSRTYAILYPPPAGSAPKPQPQEPQCVACQGLYQHLDRLHAPAVAAEVRRSPYVDSTRLSVNVNVCRGFTFLWLHHALCFYATSRHFLGGTSGPARATAATEQEMSDQDSLAASEWRRSIHSHVVPEEFSSFKDMFVCDVRARVLQYLTVPHEALAATRGPCRPAGLAAYLAALRLSEESTNDAFRPEKKARTENQDRSAVRCGHAFTEIDAVASNGVVVDVDVRHPLSSLLADGRTCMPQQYCTNKSSSAMITFGTIIDHVSPFLFATAAEGLKRAAEGKCLVPIAATVAPRVFHTNIFIIGRYRKMLRGLSQSPWFGDGGRIGSFSLQEVIAEPVLPLFFPSGVPPSILPTSVAKRAAQAADEAVDQPAQARKCHGRLTGGLASPWQDQDPFEKALEQVFAYGRYKFHSAGREDVDVRMLGTGRPFVLEVIDPHRQSFGPDDLEQMTDSINAAHDGAVEVEGLAFTSADVTVTLARHSESKTKHYRCVVWSSRAIDSDADPQLVACTQARDLLIQQRTPLRVLHRRSLLDRPRVIHSIAIQRVNAHWLVVDLETQAGTYIKEFVHGDMGRTLPSLGMLLGSRTDIIQLDVMGMVMDGDFLTRTCN
jgi:tRNA pseudouridine synthase 10